MPSLGNMPDYKREFTSKAFRATCSDGQGRVQYRIGSYKDTRVETLGGPAIQALAYAYACIFPMHPALLAEMMADHIIRDAHHQDEKQRVSLPAKAGQPITVLKGKTAF
jgi:hypothetical protein